MPRPENEVLKAAAKKVKPEKFDNGELPHMKARQKIDMMRASAKKLGVEVANDVFGKKEYHTSESVNYTDVTVMKTVDSIYPIEFHDGMSLSMQNKKDILSSFERGFDHAKWEIQWKNRNTALGACCM